MDGILYYQGLLYVPKIIRSKLISKHHDNFLAGHFGINKIQELITSKYYLLTLCCNFEAYVTSCDICLALKVVKYKHYGDLQSDFVVMSQWKDLSIDFLNGLSSTNWKSETYKSNLVIVNLLTKIVYYR